MQEVNDARRRRRADHPQPAATTTTGPRLHHPRGADVLGDCHGCASQRSAGARTVLRSPRTATGCAARDRGRGHDQHVADRADRDQRPGSTAGSRHQAGGITACRDASGLTRLLQDHQRAAGRGSTSRFARFGNRPAGGGNHRDACAAIVARRTDLIRRGTSNRSRLRQQRRVARDRRRHSGRPHAAAGRPTRRGTSRAAGAIPAGVDGVHHSHGWRARIDDPDDSPGTVPDRSNAANGIRCARSKRSWRTPPEIPGSIRC